MIVLELLLNGILLGGLYALFGLGLVLIFGVMRIANIAHGDLAILGAYFVLMLPLPLTVSVPLALVAGAGLGWVLQRAALSRVIGPDPMPALLVTFGVSVLIQNGLVETFGANVRSIETGRFGTGSVSLGAVSAGYLPLAIFGTSAVLFAGVHWLLSRTAFGRAVRATASNPELVGYFGIRRDRVFALVMAMSVAVAVLAGIFLAMRSSVTPFSGSERLLIAFEVVVIGGMGSIRSTYLAGLLLGVIHVVGFYFDPGSGQLYGHIALLVLLLLRPEGLAGGVTQR